MRRETARDSDRGNLAISSVLFDDAVNCYKYTALVVYELNMSMDIDGIAQTGTTRSNRRTSFRSVPYFQQKSHMYCRGRERGSPQ